jgi:hypothetical protein
LRRLETVHGHAPTHVPELVDARDGGLVFERAAAVAGRRLISIGYFFVGWKFPFRSYWATWVPMLTPAVVEKR